MNNPPNEVIEVLEREPPYYAKGLEVRKASVATRHGATTSYSLDFPVCTASEYVGEEGAQSIAALLVLGEKYQAEAASRLSERGE